MERTGCFFLAVACFLAVQLPVGVFAQDDEKITEYVPESEIAQQTEEKRQGWDGTLQIGATVNLVDNRNVVGQVDGYSTLLGLSFVSGLDFIRMKHEWHSALQISESFSRTPTLPEFVKSDDRIELESIYNYFLIKWFGFFGRVNGTTALFKTQRITPEPVTYAIARPDGTVEVDEEPRERLLLADEFQPLTLNESVGVFAEPVQEPAIKLSTRLGFGLRETWAQGVLAVDDDEATENQIEVTDLSNPDSSLTVFQGGLEGFLGLSGQFQEKRITYDTGATVLVPFINNDSEDRSATELTRVGVVATVGFAFFDWMSLNYRLRVMRDPQLVEDVQVQNNLLLTFKYTFIEPVEEEEESPEPTEAEEAKERAEEAEKRAEEAEERIEELQEQLEEARREAAEESEPEPETPSEPETPPEPEPPPEP